MATKKKKSRTRRAMRLAAVGAMIADLWRVDSDPYAAAEFVRRQLRDADGKNPMLTTSEMAFACVAAALFNVQIEDVVEVMEERQAKQPRALLPDNPRVVPW